MWQISGVNLNFFLTLGLELFPFLYPHPLKFYRIEFRRTGSSQQLAHFQFIKWLFLDIPSKLVCTQQTYTKKGIIQNYFHNFRVPSSDILFLDEFLLFLADPFTVVGPVHGHIIFSKLKSPLMYHIWSISNSNTLSRCSHHYNCASQGPQKNVTHWRENWLFHLRHFMFLKIATKET